MKAHLQNLNALQLCADKLTNKSPANADSMTELTKCPSALASQKTNHASASVILLVRRPNPPSL
jgi:hypothetical protein